MPLHHCSTVFARLAEGKTNTEFSKGSVEKLFCKSQPSYRKMIMQKHQSVDVQESACETCEGRNCKQKKQNFVRRDYHVNKDTSTQTRRTASHGFRDGAHATFHVAPSSFDPLQFPHHMMQQHISTRIFLHHKEQNACDVILPLSAETKRLQVCAFLREKRARCQTHKQKHLLCRLLTNWTQKSEMNKQGNAAWQSHPREKHTKKEVWKSVERSMKEKHSSTTYPLPALYGEDIAPIVASVASVAFKGSDSNHLSRIFEAGAVINSRNGGKSCPSFRAGWEQHEQQ